MALLDLVSTIPIILLEIDSLSYTTHQSDKLYFSNTSFITEPSDSPSSTRFNPKITSNLTLSSKLFGSTAGSLASSELNQISLSNLDGNLDTLLTDYLLEGRQLTLKYGGRGDSYDTFTVVFTGTLESLTFTGTDVNLLVSNFNSKLSTPIAGEVYAPSGAPGYSTFNTSLHGKRLPVTYGVVKNISPHYVRNTLVGDTSNSSWDPYLYNISSLSNSNTTTTCTNLGTQSTFSRVGVRGGSKRYMEFHTNFTGPAMVGVANPSALPMSANIGSSATGVGFSAEDGGLLVASVLSDYSNGYLGGSIIGVAIDGSAGSIWFSKNGTWIGDPASGTDPAYAGYVGELMPGVTMSVEGDTATCKFKAGDLTYNPPTGFNEVDDTKVVVAQLSYKVHDKNIFNVICVHSDGVDLAEDQYVPDLTTGEFQVTVGSVGSTRITADIQGDVTPNPLDSAATILTDLLTNRISTISLDSDSIGTLASPYFAGESLVGRASCGSYYAKGEPISVAVEEYTKSFNLQAGFNNLGIFNVSVFTGPVSAASILNLTEEHIASITVQGAESPQYSKTVGYAHNYTKFNTEGVAPSVLYDNPDQFSFMVHEWRTASATNRELGIDSGNQVEGVPLGLEANYSTIQNRYLNSIEGPLTPSVIFSGIDALLESKRRWRLASSGGKLVTPPSYRIKLPFILSGLNLNDTIQVTYPRFSLVSGSFVTLIGASFNLMDSTTTLTVWEGAEDSFTLGSDVDIDTLEIGFIEYLGCTPKVADVAVLIPFGDAESPFGLGTQPYAT